MVPSLTCASVSLVSVSFVREESGTFSYLCLGLLGECLLREGGERYLLLPVSRSPWGVSPS